MNTELTQEEAVALLSLAVASIILILVAFFWPAMRNDLVLISISIALMAGPILLFMRAVNMKPEKYPIVVDYGLSLAQLISLGNYKQKDNEINENNFPVSVGEKEKIILEIISFDRPMDTDEIFQDIQSRDLRPATLLELLSFGAQYRTPMNPTQLVSLDQRFRDSKNKIAVPVIDVNYVTSPISSLAVAKNLKLIWTDSKWNAGTNFAVVSLKPLN